MTRRKLAIYITVSAFISAVLAWFLPAWAATPFGLYFSLIIPGLLILLLLKKSLDVTWKSFLYIIGLGVACLIFTTLLTNLVLRPMGVIRPLTPGPIFLAIGFVITLLLTLGIKRWSSKPLERLKFSLSKIDVIAIVAPLILLIAFICGAIRLNNGTSGWLTIVCYVGSAGLVAWLFAVHNKLKLGSIIWALWLISLGILLSGWLRSNYVTGMDVVGEFQIFELVKHTGYWSIGLYHNIYTACLSVSILPVALSFFTKLPDTLIFKLIIPTLYSLIVPIVFLVVRSQTRVRGAILATFFFFAQPTFTIWWWIPIRQEIAFLFFGLLILLFVSEKKTVFSKSLFLIFGISMVVSHYSTSYITIGIFLLYCLIQTIRKIIWRRHLNEASLLSYGYVIILLLCTFLWYSQLTTGFSGVDQFMTKSFQNIGSLFSSDTQQQGQTAASHLNFFNNSAGVAPVTPPEYAAQQVQKVQAEYGNNNLYPADYGFEQASYEPQNSKLSQNINFIRNILKASGNLLVGIGIVIIGFIAWRKRKITNLVCLQLTSLLFFAIALYLPFFSISYGEDRLYLQMLVALSAGVVVYGSIYFIKKRWHFIIQILLLVFITAYFLLLNQVPQQLTTSSQQSLTLGNNNEQYFVFYIYSSDVVAAKWLEQNVNHAIPVFGDSYSHNKIATGAGLFTKFNSGVLPGGIPRLSYVYQDTSNTVTGAAFDDDQGTIIYEFPTDFLSFQKDTVYTNKQDIIYR
jgi:uncharacterized membrane protein